MALSPRHVPVTRDQVYDWLQEYKSLKKQNKNLKVHDHLAGKLNDLNLPDTMVDTTYHDDLDDQTPLIEMIFMDLPSYGYES